MEYTEMKEKGALSGFKVLDLSRLLPGPFCSMLLADMGADVIKVEDPRQGDYIRWWPPLIGKNSGFHVVLNRNKRSLTLNLKLPEGKDLFKRVVREVDVLLEGFRPGVMSKLGLGYEVLKTINPKLVYCSITGYGTEGQRSQKAGHDINYLALNGVLSYSGREGQPTVTGVQIADLGGGGLLAAFSIVTALLARERLGVGQFIDVPMMDGALTWNCLRWGKYLGDDTIPFPGDDFLNHGFACYNIYETRDGRHMSLGALEPQFWKAFCDAAKRPEWNQPNYFEPGPHQQALQQKVASFFRQRTLAEWVDHFQGTDCCCEPILNLAEVMDDPDMKARQMVVEMMHESWGAYRQLGIAPKFSLTPGAIKTHAPELGEHTRSILGELGISPDEIEALRRKGAV
jgi:crotonobetainyl-CoA:carnitine CoA-transferase CaiB-like acyl-CoA transferase